MSDIPPTISEPSTGGHDKQIIIVYLALGALALWLLSTGKLNGLFSSGAVSQQLPTGGAGSAPTAPADTSTVPDSSSSATTPPDSSTQTINRTPDGSPPSTVTPPPRIGSTITYMGYSYTWDPDSNHFISPFAPPLDSNGNPIPGIVGYPTSGSRQPSQDVAVPISGTHGGTLPNRIL